jgi:hypothetical protein
MLAPNDVSTLRAAALCIKTHSALLAAWIESNILLQLASPPFDKQDETLVNEAGSQMSRRGQRPRVQGIPPVGKPVLRTCDDVNEIAATFSVRQ